MENEKQKGLIIEIMRGDEELGLYEQPTLVEVINNLKDYVLTLDRYENSFGSGYGDCWGTMEVDENGEYIKLEDVLALFSAKK